MLYIKYKYLTANSIKLIEFERGESGYMINKYYNFSQTPFNYRQDNNSILSQFEKSRTTSLEWITKSSCNYYNILTTDLDKYIRDNKLPENSIKCDIRNHFLENLLNI